MCSNEILNKAVDAVVSSFKSHSQTEVNAVEALSEFWQLKEAKGSNFENGCLVKYETSSTTSPIVSFVTLPGGSCFGSFEECQTIETSRQSAAKIALTNSVLNEHSCNIISPSTIGQMVSSASVSFCSSQPDSYVASLQIFRSFLEDHMGKSFLAFQEKMSVLQLLHWNGSLKEMKKNGCSRQEVLHHYLSRGIDDAMLSKMIDSWINYDKDQPGIILKELQEVRKHVEGARVTGRELRFHKEKLYILQEALKQLHES